MTTDSKPKRLRIGMALESLHRYGGLTRSGWEIAQELGKSNDVIFFTNHAELTGDETFKVELIDLPKIPYLKKILFALKVSQTKKIYALDILHTHGTSGLWQDVVTAHSVHKHWFRYSLAKTKPLTWPWFRKLLNPLHYVTIALEEFQYSSRHHKKIIAISHQVKADLIRLFGLDQSRIQIVHQGVNIIEFDPEHAESKRAELRQAEKINPDQTVIIFVAHEFRRKGLEVLLEAMSRSKDLTSVLWVCGGDNPAPFNDQIKSLGLVNRVKFLGVAKNIQDYYAASDIFAFPTSYEAFGLVITEAMAAGLPVIVPKDAGAAELITDRVDGLLLSRWDAVDELIQCLNLLADPVFRQQIGKAARSRAMEWRWSDNAKKTLDVYKEITSTR